ncbi:hypothetical protein FHS85_004545 [Rhodoligotrophos appendicifer]|uniref:hypothetical protein n=1 Tax=Rhodoligotrophos appendicifer TaxID=987056 RepID=UPI001185A043|nr:hypothetical protein [Rhodoligotrophos appendicifer]
MAKTFFIKDGDGWKFEVDGQPSEKFTSWIEACGAAIEAAKAATREGEDAHVMSPNDRGGWYSLWASPS